MLRFWFDCIDILRSKLSRFLVAGCTNILGYILDSLRILKNGHNNESSKCEQSKSHLTLHLSEECIKEKQIIS